MKQVIDTEHYWKLNKRFATVDGFCLGNPTATCMDSKMSMCFQITVSRSHSNNVTQESACLLKAIKERDMNKKCAFYFALPKSRLEADIKFFYFILV